MAKNQIKEFSGDMQDYLERIGNLNPQEIYALSKEILENPELSKKLASGNKNFLKQGINYFEKYGEEKFSDTKYPQAMENHLKKALPHQEGFIASKAKSLSLDSGVEGYERIVNELSNIRGLSLNGLVELGDEVTKDPLLKSVPGQKSNLKILRTFVDAYEALVEKEGVDKAEAYLKGASGPGKIRINTMKNILSKSYLPNLLSHLNKK